MSKAKERLQAIQAEAWGHILPTERLARLIAGDVAALDQPCTPLQDGEYARQGRELRRLRQAAQAIMDATHRQPGRLRDRAEYSADIPCDLLCRLHEALSNSEVQP